MKTISIEVASVIFVLTGGTGLAMNHRSALQLRTAEASLASADSRLQAQTAELEELKKANAKLKHALDSTETQPGNKKIVQCSENVSEPNPFLIEAIIDQKVKVALARKAYADSLNSRRPASSGSEALTKARRELADVQKMLADAKESQRRVREHEAPELERLKSETSQEKSALKTQIGSLEEKMHAIASSGRENPSDDVNAQLSSVATEISTLNEELNKVRLEEGRNRRNLEKSTRRQIEEGDKAIASLMLQLADKQFQVEKFGGDSSNPATIAAAIAETENAAAILKQEVDKLAVLERDLATSLNH